MKTLIIVRFGQDWSLELYQQINARLRRPGQKQTVIIHHLVAVNSIEEDVAKALEKKDRKWAMFRRELKDKKHELERPKKVPFWKHFINLF